MPWKYTTGIRRAPWWTVVESDSRFRNANAAHYHCANGPTQANYSRKGDLFCLDSYTRDRRIVRFRLGVEVRTDDRSQPEHQSKHDQ